MAELTLYVRKFCPYCKKVLDYMEENKITILIKEINNPDFQKELESIGGKSQVPCLIIDGKPLYESNDIIDWLHENAVTK